MSEAEKIKMFLKEHDFMSVKKIEQRCGLPRNTLQNHVNGYREIPEQHIRKVVDFLTGVGYN